MTGASRSGWQPLELRCVSTTASGVVLLILRIIIIKSSLITEYSAELLKTLHLPFLGGVQVTESIVNYVKSEKSHPHSAKISGCSSEHCHGLCVLSSARRRQPREDELKCLCATMQVVESFVGCTAFPSPTNAPRSGVSYPLLQI
jgi:hypothetical protein